MLLEAERWKIKDAMPWSVTSLKREEQVRSASLFRCSSSTIAQIFVNFSFLFLFVSKILLPYLKGRRVECVLKMGDLGTSFRTTRICLHSTGPRRSAVVSEWHSVK